MLSWHDTYMGVQCTFAWVAEHSMWKYIQIVCRNTCRWVESAEVKACLFEPRWLPLPLRFPLAARRWRNGARDVIQYLPIKWCPGACLANAANLCIFRDRTLEAAVLAAVGGQPLYITCSLDQPTQQQQQKKKSGGSIDGQQLIRGSPEQVGFALMPQGFVKEENISVYRATPHHHYLFIHPLGVMCWQPGAAQSCDEQNIVV